MKRFLSVLVAAACAMNFATAAQASTSDLSITNSDGVTVAVPGASVTYTVTASNAGPDDALGSTVADTFPASLTCTWTCVGAGGGTCTPTGSGNINDLANLPNGGSVTYTAACNISSSAAGSLIDIATVTPPNGFTDPTPGNNTATDTDTLTPKADLSVSNTDGATSVAAGGPVTYTIIASNAGPSDVLGATVADTFPAATLSACTWTCAGSGNGTCAASGTGNINDNTVNLPNGSSVTYTATCSVLPSAIAAVSDTATVAAPAGVTDPTPGNNSATDTDTLLANLGITNSDGVTTAAPGGGVTYTITASNAGPSYAASSTVVDTFPAPLTSCTWTCAGANGGTCTTSGSLTASGSGNISTSINLAVGGSVTYTAHCVIPQSATGSFSNTATVATSANVTDPTPANNSVTDTDTLASQADLSITNTDGVTTQIPGGPVTYTITASNAGPSNAPGSTVVDNFPAALTCSWTCAGSAGGTCGLASGSGNINDTSVNLPFGGSVTYTASCTISPAAAGSLSNTATVAANTGGGITDPVSTNNSATDTDSVTPQANLVLTNTDSVNFGQITPGQTTSATFKITVTNPTGPSNVPAANVVDAFPAPLTSCTWTCTGSAGGTCTASGAGNLNDFASVPKGGQVQYKATCSVPATITAGSPLINTATVTDGKAADGITTITELVPADNTVAYSESVLAKTNLTVTLTDGQTTVAPNDNVTYTMTVKNVTDVVNNIKAWSAAPGTTIVDTFPASLVGCTWTCTGTGTTCPASGSGNINHLVDLPAGSSVTYTEKCKVAANATGTVVNVGSLTPAANVMNPNLSTSAYTATDGDVVSVPANIAVTMTDNRDFAQVGDVVDYVIDVTNPAGPAATAAEVIVVDVLPPELGGGSWTCTPSANAQCGNGSGNALEDVAQIPVGGTVEYVYSAVVQIDNATDSIVNTATASLKSGSDPATANNSTTDSDAVSIFKDTFEGSPSLATNVNSTGAAHVTAQLQVNNTLLSQVGIVPVDLAKGRSANGSDLFTLQIARFGQNVMLRTLTTDVNGINQISEWQKVDLTSHPLELDWQSASQQQSDGYFAVAAGGTPVLIDGRSISAQLSSLQITIQNTVPWLTLIGQ